VVGIAFLALFTNWGWAQDRCLRATADSQDFASSMIVGPNLDQASGPGSGSVRIRRNMVYASEKETPAAKGDDENPRTAGVQCAPEGKWAHVWTLDPQV
jgi:hypothetical protein